MTIQCKIIGGGAKDDSHCCLYRLLLVLLVTMSERSQEEGNQSQEHAEQSDSFMMPGTSQTSDENTVQAPTGEYDDLRNCFHLRDWYQLK